MDVHGDVFDMLAHLNWRLPTAHSQMLNCSLSCFAHTHTSAFIRVCGHHECHNVLVLLWHNQKMIMSVLCRLKQMEGLKLHHLDFYMALAIIHSVGVRANAPLNSVIVNLQRMKFSNKWLVLAIKNQATGHYILNGKGEEARSRTFIDLGVEWNYIIEDDVETLHTEGPLHDAVVVLVTTYSMIIIQSFSRFWRYGIKVLLSNTRRYIPFNFLFFFLLMALISRVHNLKVKASDQVNSDQKKPHFNEAFFFFRRSLYQCSICLICLLHNL